MEKRLSMKKTIATFFFLLSILCASSQVREVKSRATSYKESSKDSSSGSRSYDGDDAGDAFLVELFAQLFTEVIFGGIYSGVYAAQYGQLVNADIEDWRVSGEFKMSGGLNIGNVNFFDSQMIRGNWGLFSTQLRRMNVNDVSGGFTTIDWQILQLNLINLKNVRWLVGAGFSHETEVDQTHFEFATELHVSLSDKFMPSLTYRASGDGHPREEFSGILEYRPFRGKSTEVAFSGGYLYQQLYGIDFHFPSVGVVLYLK